MARTLRRFTPIFKTAHYLILFLSWSGWFYIIFKIHPQYFAQTYYVPLLGLMIVMFWSILRFFFHRWVVALIIAGGLVSMIALRLYGFRDWYYPVLIGGMVISLCVVFQTSSGSKPATASDSELPAPAAPVKSA